MVALRRPARLRLVLLALCTLLLAQWTLAAHACPFIGQTAERIAQARIAQALSDTAMTGCPHHAKRAAHDGDGPGSPGQPSPICLKHCADETSASNGLTAVADAPPPAPALPVKPLPSAQLQRVGDRPDWATAAGPPLIIQYCVSLT